MYATNKVSCLAWIYFILCNTASKGGGETKSKLLEAGFLRTLDFSDATIQDPFGLHPSPILKLGMIQNISTVSSQQLSAALPSPTAPPFLGITNGRNEPQVSDWAHLLCKQSVSGSSPSTLS